MNNEQKTTEQGTNDVQTTSPETQETIIQTGEGQIHIVHEVSLGDVVTSVLLVCILITMLFDSFARRF